MTTVEYRPDTLADEMAEASDILSSFIERASRRTAEESASAMC